MRLIAANEQDGEQVKIVVMLPSVEKKKKKMSTFRNSIPCGVNGSPFHLSTPK